MLCSINSNTYYIIILLVQLVLLKCWLLQRSQTVPKMENLGNTCFMNSAVQLLSASDAVRSVLLQHVLCHFSAGTQLLHARNVHNSWPD